MLAWLLVPVAVAEDWTLQAAVAHALVHNLGLRQEGLDTASAGAVLASARADLGPILAASGGASGFGSAAAPDATDDGVSWDLGISQPLPTGGTLWVGGAADRAFARRIGPETTVSSFTGLTVSQPLLDGAWSAARYATDAARLDLSAAELGERDARERLVVSVANAYWELVGAREATRLAVRSVEIATSQLADTRERSVEGFAGSGDVLQLERAHGVARQSQVVAAASEAAAERTLARRMGLPLERAPRLVPVDRPDPPAAQPDPATALARARVGNTTWRSAQLAGTAALRDFQEARNAALPDVTVSASVGLSDSDPSWAMGATLTMPLAWTGARADRTRGKLSLQRSTLETEAAWEDLVAQVQEALEAIHRDRARVELVEVTLRAAQAGLAADQELYREGRGSTRDVVRSLESLEEAQVGGLSAQIDLQSSLLELARLQGTVLSDLGFEVPPATPGDGRAAP